MSSEVRFLGELGINLQKIMKRLLANQNLLRYLYYTDKDPLNTDKENISSKTAYGDGSNSIVRIVPLIEDKVDSTSILVLRVVEGEPFDENTEFLNIKLAIEIFVPITQWVMKDSNLRPFAIMGEVQRSLEGRTINGLGKIKGDGFSTNFFTNEISAYIMPFSINQYV